MKGKGKLICKIGQLALFLEDHGEGELFKVAVLEPEGGIAAAVFVSMADAIFFERCLGAAVDTVFQHNVKEQWYED